MDWLLATWLASVSRLAARQPFGLIQSVFEQSSEIPASDDGSSRNFCFHKLGSGGDFFID
jgi:hypothetical protein